jgi:hypothetical protein
LQSIKIEKAPELISHRIGNRFDLANLIKDQAQAQHPDLQN